LTVSPIDIIATGVTPPVDRRIRWISLVRTGVVAGVVDFPPDGHVTGDPLAIPEVGVVWTHVPPSAARKAVPIRAV
jgi:hypothetical protein